MIIPAQCRAGRGLVGWSLGRLSEASAIPARDIAEFEAGRGIGALTGTALQRALEQGGVQFIAEGKVRGPGVRLKFSRLIVKRIDVWENEGGLAGDDDA